MTQSIRHLIATTILDNLRIQERPVGKLAKLYANIELKKGTVHPELHCSLSEIRKIFGKETTGEILNQNYGSEVVSCTATTNKLIYKLDKRNFMQNALLEKPHFPNVQSSQTILVEFSSPNIAKPFHVGHLRSTIIGNFIGNLYKTLNANVVRLNYLGDWGTQFGYLAIGMNLLKPTDEQMKLNPIKHLFDAYVHANRLGENDSNIGSRAKDLFQQLETGKIDNLENWMTYRKYTVDELSRIYNRLGVVFDEYCWESDYAKSKIGSFLESLKQDGVLELGEEGAYVIKVDDRYVPIIKGDGTTLYLTRDIAALNHRSEKYKFHKLYYVVDNGQHDHFQSLIKIGSKLCIPGVEQNGVEHIKFGRIKKMSTRKGNVVFLKDILDEARDIMRQRQANSPTTKVDLENNESNTDDILGISAVIINDLKQRRQRDYEFDWNKLLQVNGDTGIKLQYTHCRLCSLVKNTGIQPSNIVECDLLCESEAEELIYEIARFPEIIYRCQDKLEACVLVNYLFSLSNTISRALKNLNIKNETRTDVQEQRMLLFIVARSVLKQGMQILGLQPLTEM